VAQNRHLSRTICMQTLYEWEFRSGGLTIEEVTERNIGEFKKDIDEDYVHGVINGCIKNLAAIDAEILEAAPEWPLDQISRVDKNVLRVALYEMLFDPSDDVPPRVSINEAIEIGKTFGGESTPKFVNGVLGSIYRKYNDRLAPRDER
jgi:transcription antitermination protein NusB